MSKKTFLIFPHQLFESQELLKTAAHVILVEDNHFFGRMNFHKQKLIFHRASMKAYAAMVKKKGIDVEYFDYHVCKNGLKKVFDFCKKNKISTLDMFDVVDHELMKRLTAEAKSFKLALSVHNTPIFLLTQEDIIKMLPGKKRHTMASFYTKMRKRFNILMIQGKPLGGTWSFDSQNREPIPPHLKIPSIPKKNQSSFVREARSYIEKLFPNNPGVSDSFIYPVTTAQSLKWLGNFLKTKLKLFGSYQDAMKESNPISFHSLLSPLLNSGLLLPQTVINETLEYANKEEIPLNSLEGFIRQIIGWREFVRGVYCLTGKSQKSSNFFKHKKRLSKGFWKATTGVTPLDISINHVLKYAYTNHIERLMVIGNFMLLSQIHPDDVYQWFMELFIDAYDWVMVPNVYGMSQYADGGSMTSKPYCSSSKYILGMSDYKKGAWCELWDALYWNFIHQHAKLFSANPRMNLVVSLLKKMNPKRLLELMSVADNYLKKKH
ncbi:cryptochrome/photolyase family protein [Candidatus Dependentiae bacterium]|jgi:deoxyribodipyrimidine photolyase-related protein|nr:cryptochrome/photolyase family protein [Candidatus Dependentiae bacterium]